MMALTEVTGGGGVYDPEEEERLRKLRLAAVSSQQNLQLSQGVNPATALRKPDTNTSIMSTINAVGGPKAYSMRVNRIADFWRKNFGTPIPAIVALDLARLPMSDDRIEQGLLAAKQGSGLYRGLITRGGKAVATAFAQAGGLYLGDDNKTTKQRQIEQRWLSEGLIDWQKAADMNLSHKELVLDILWNTRRTRGALSKDRTKPWQIYCLPAETTVPYSEPAVLPSAPWEIGTDLYSGKEAFLQPEPGEQVGILSAPFVALDWLNRQEATMLLFFYEYGKHGLRPLLGLDPGWEMRDLGVTEAMTPDAAANQVYKYGIKPGMTEEAIQAKLKESGLTQETGVMRAWADAKAAVDRGQSAFGAMSNDAFGWDVQKELPWLDAALSIAWSASVEYPAWLVVRAGINEKHVQKLTKWALDRYTPIDNMAALTATMHSPGRIAAVTGMKHYPELCEEMAEATTPQAERAIMERAALETTQVVSPDDYMLWQQMKVAIRSTPEFNALPPTLRRVTQLMPETDSLPIRSAEIYDSVSQLCGALNIDQARTWKFLDEALTAKSDHARAAVLTRIWAEADQAKIAAAAERQALHGAGRIPRQALEGVPEPVLYAQDPWAQTVKEMSFRAVPSDLEVAASREGYLKLVDDLYNTEKTRASRLAEKLAAGTEPEAAAAALRAETEEGLRAVRSALHEHLTSLETPLEKGNILKLARTYARDALKELRPEIHTFIKQHGGIRWTDDWEQALIAATGRQAERLTRLRSTNELVRAGGYTPTEMAGLIHSVYGEKAGIATSEDLRRWCLGQYQNLKPEGYMARAEADLLTAQQEAGYQSLTALDKQLEELSEGIASGDVPLDRLFTSADDIKAQLSAASDEVALIESGRSGHTVPTPLMPYQTLQYWKAPVSMRFIVPEFSGITGHILDEVSRGVIIPKNLKGTGLFTLGTVAGGVAGTETARLNNPDAGWQQLLTGAILGAAAGGALSAGAVKRFMHIDPAAAMKVTPNVDLMTDIWKKLALAALGVKTRILMDEPFRMFMEGYGWNAVKAWFRGPARRALEDEGQYLAPFTEDQGEVMLSYLSHEASQTTMGLVRGTDSRWPETAARIMKIYASQRPTQVWMEGGREGLLKYAMSPAGQTHIAAAGYKSPEGWVDVADDYLTRLTHVPVKANAPVIDGTGRLTDEAAAEWRAYQQALKKDPTATAPDWYDPDYHSVRYARTAEMGPKDKPVAVLYRRNQIIMDMLDRNSPMLISRKNLKRITPEDRPSFQARLPYKDNAVKNAVTAFLDLGTNMSDTITKNVRSNVYAVEYTRHLERLKQVAKERNLPWDETKVHHIADQYARDRVKYLTYQSQRTGFEQLLRDVVPFAPAQRDFLRYWGTKALKNPPFLMAWTRMQALPEDAQLHIEKEWAWGAGGVLNWVLGGTLYGLNAAALTFFTGGAGVRSRTEEGVAGLKAHYIMENFIPGWGPIITVPIDYMIEMMPELQGPINSLPNLSLAGKGSPLFGRGQRLIYGMEAMALYMLQEAGLMPPTWHPIDLPGRLGRDRDYYLAREQHLMAYIAATSGKDLAGIEKGSEEWRDLLLQMREMMAKETFWEGLGAWLLPTTPWIKVQEEQDVRSFLSEYYEALSSGESGLPAGVLATVVDPAGNVMPGPSQALTKEATDKVRAKYPDYANGADILDALQFGDADAIEAAISKDETWLPYLIYMTEKLDGELADYGLETPKDSMEQWLLEMTSGLRQRKDTPVYFGDFIDKAKRREEYNLTRKMRQEFDERTAGLDTGTVEYEQARAAFNEDLARRIRLLRGPRLKGTETDESLISSASSFYMQVPEESTEAKANQEWLELRAKNLAKDYKEKVALYRERYGSSEAATQAIEYLTQWYESDFDEQGLDTKYLHEGEPQYQAEVDMRNLYLGIVKDPWGMNEEEMAAKNIVTTTLTDQSIRTYLEMKLQTTDALAQAGLASIWTKKAAYVREEWQQQVADLCLQDSGFALAYTYYQMDTWERLRDYGGDTYTSPAWREWFDYLSRRDAWVEANIDTQTFYFFKDYKDNTDLGRQRVEWQREADQLLGRLMIGDASFREQYYKLIEASSTVWDKRRNW